MKRIRKKHTRLDRIMPTNSLFIQGTNGGIANHDTRSGLAVARGCSMKFRKIHRKTPSPESQACNFIKKESLAQVFSCKFYEISKDTFFYRTSPVAAPANLKSTGNNYFTIRKFSMSQTNIVARQNENHKIHYLRTALFVKQFIFLF